MELQVTRRQLEFIRSEAFETLFGGAAGGGKSYAQLIDALLFAVTYPRSAQLVLRRTFPELKRSLIRTSVELYPQPLARYTETTHRWLFFNGSVIEFGYCDSEGDVTKYQSAEYDVIRFDELTHFTEYQFTYLLSRIRGTNGYPKQVKSSTNPGGVGHDWVKRRYIDPLIPGEQKDGKLFLPAKVQDNCFLMKHDPDYVRRMELLGAKERRALLYGEWDLFEGRYFDEFSADIHVCEPFALPEHWRRYLTIDYGLDMLAAYWIALDPQGTAWVYRERYQSGLILSRAAEVMLEAEQPGEHITQRFAPPDLFNRRQETGRSAADIFAEQGLYFDRASAERIPGWYALKEYLRPYRDEQGVLTARLRIFPTCRNLIRTLPAIQHDKTQENDTANTPHELTHAPDALRYFAKSVYPDPLPALTSAEERETDEFLTFQGGNNRWNM